MPIKKRNKTGVLGFNEPNLPAPEYPDAISGTSGKIDREKYDENEGLRFLMHAWAAPDYDDLVSIEWSPVGIEKWTELTTIPFEEPIEEPTVEFVIPMSVLNHGRYEFRFKVKNGEGGQYLDFSSKSLADIDLFAPFQRLGSSMKPPIAGFPDFLALPTDVISQQVIDQNPEFTFKIPPYADWETGDRVRYWFTLDNPADDGEPINTLPMPEEGLEIDVPNTFFANPLLLDGNLFFVYQLLDAAKNVGELSRNQGRTLKRSSGLILSPLIIREQVVDGLIDIPELEANVVVAIPIYAYQPRDQYIVRWGSQTHGPFLLSGVFDFDITLPRQLIVDEFGSSTVPVTTSATYTILRNGGTDSPPTATDIEVNLWVPGPTPPAPGEENPDLPAVHVFGPASSPTPDYLDKTDFDDPGEIEAHITLWITPSPRANDIIRVYWGSKMILAGTFLIGAEAPGADIVINLDKTELAKLGNGSHNVFYTVSEPDSLNDNLSESTPVEVDGAIEHIMDAAVFQNPQTWPGDPRGRLNCTSLRGAGAVPGQYLEVWIPPNPEFFGKDVDVLIEFHGSNGVNGDLPAIAGTTGSQTITLDQNMADNGFMFHYGPYVPFLKPITGFLSPYMSSWLQYSVNLGGTWARSIPAVIPVRMYTSNNACDL